MGWTGTETTLRTSEHILDRAKENLGRSWDVLDSVIFRQSRKDEGFVFSAIRIDENEVIGMIQLFEFNNYHGKTYLSFKDIDESMGPFAVPYGPRGRRVLAKLTDSKYANPEWRAQIR